MSDPFLTLGRVLMLVTVPVMLLFPLVFAALVPTRAGSDAARIVGRTRLLLLGLATLLLFGCWIGLLLTGLRFPGAMVAANFWWFWFFPLWFLLAWPAVAAKRPDWGPNALGLAWPSGFPAGAGEVRSASLVNRQRHSPVTRRMWAVPALVFLVAFGAIAARGLMPFPMGADSTGSTAASTEANATSAGAQMGPSTEVGRVERSRWVRTLTVYGGVYLFMLTTLPWILRRVLTEPEPMDARGSAELAALYEQQRRRRVLGLFWGAGVLLPAAMGALLALPVWFPSEGSLWGLIGGIGGVMLGVGGAIFGTWMTVERAKIAEVRARLQQSQPLPTPSTGEPSRAT